MPPSSAKTKPAQKTNVVVRGDDKAIVARLNGLLRLTLDQQRESNKTLVGDQILVLMDAGLSQTDSGRILGVPPNQIPSYLKKAKNKVLLKKLKKKEAA